MAQAHTATDVEAVLAQCSAAHREALEQTSSAAVAASQDAARKHERSQRIAIARCLRRLGRQVDSDVDEAVELVAVASTSYDDRHAPGAAAARRCGFDGAEARATARRQGSLSLFVTYPGLKG